MSPHAKMMSVSFIAAFALVTAGGCRSLRIAVGGRDAWQKPEQVIEALAIRPGEHLADIGAGSGYFTFRLADATGPAGRVYAVDIDESDLERLRRSARERGLSNVSPVLARPESPGLPAAGLDLLFLCNTYHHLPDRVGYLRGLRMTLRPGGRIAIIEMQDLPWYLGHGGHQTDSRAIRSEMEAAGYVLSAEHRFLELQSFLEFTAPVGPPSLGR